VSVLWHDLECGGYREDLPLWRALAGEHGDPILDVGAGTGRIALDLARHRHRVTALDRDAALLAELERRADGLDLSTVVADARSFELEQRFALCVVPMQTVQLLGGPDGRGAFLRCARDHLRPGGMLAIALADMLETYETVDGGPAPLPDMAEHDGVVYASQPTAVRADEHGFVLERRREIVAADGRREVSEDRIRLDRLTAGELEREGTRAGLTAAERARVPATADYVGSEVVMLRA
jgi:SAM-dependent methyltransferase